MLETYSDNTLGWARSVIRNSDLFISGTQSAETTYNSISFQTANGELLTDLELAKMIDNNYYSYAMSGVSLFEGNTDEYSTIVHGTPKRILELQEKMLQDNDDYINGVTDVEPNNNFLIQELEVQTRKGIKYLGINNKNKPTTYQNDIYRAWMDLYNTLSYNEDGTVNIEKDHHNKQLAIYLAKYAFTASGFQNNLAQFFTHIPHQILMDNNVSGDIRQQIKDVETMVGDSRFVDQLQRHSKDNPKIVKALKIKSQELGSTAGFIYKPAKYKSQEFGSVHKKGGKESRFFPKFVKGVYSKFNNVYQRNENYDFLFEKIGTVEREDSEGKMIMVPVYARTFELGRSEGKYKTFEYNKNADMTESNIKSNNLPKGIQDKTDDFVRFAKADPTFRDINDTEVTQQMLDSEYERSRTNMEIVQQNLNEIIKDKNIKCK